MSRIEVLFVDKGGVLVDNRNLAPQWRRLLGEVLPRELGGDADAWRTANDRAHVRKIERWHERHRAGPASGARYFLVEYDRLWLWDMCDTLEVPRPAVEETDVIARRVIDYVLLRLDAAFPGNAEALRAISARGVRLHTASGDASADLEDYLRAVGVRDLFDRLNGADLVDTLKVGPEFYRAILEDCGVDPLRAAVVDDDERALDWAGQCGLRTFRFAPDGAMSSHAVVRTLGELLPAFV
jgi:FMN phosphatase YigB (HAD superfamily)